MAVDFGSQATAAPNIPSASTPKEGVVQRPVAQTAGLTGLANLFDAATEISKQNKLTEQQKFVSDFTTKQLLVADALDQGRIRSSAHARTLMRKNLLDAIEANPGLSSDLINAQKEILGIAGGADIVKEGDDAEKRQRAQFDKLVGLGMIKPDASDQEFVRTNEDFMTAQEADRRHTIRMNTIDEALKNQSLTKAQRENLESQRTEETRKFLKESSPAYYTLQKGKYQEILDSDLSEAEKARAIEDLHAQFMADATSEVSDMSSGEFAAYTKPFEMLKDNYVKYATGQLDDEELNRGNDRGISMMERIALSDPDLLKVAAGKELFGDQLFFQIYTQSSLDVSKAMLKFMGNKGNPFSEDSTDQQAFKNYFSAVLGSLNSDNPEAKSQAEQALQEIFNTIPEFEGSLRLNPKGGITTAKLLASSSFLKARKAHPELFEDVSDAKEILQRYYGDEVWGMVKNQFRENHVLAFDPMGTKGNATPQQIPTTSLVGTRETQNGMEFFALDPENSRAVDKARDLNKNLKPVINDTIKAFAHLDGRTDYGALWEQSAKEFLGGGLTPQEGMEGGDTSNLIQPTSALNPKDFIPKDENIKLLSPKEVDTSEMGLLPSGGKMKQVKGMIIHHTGGRGTVQGVVNTLQERGLSAQYVIDRQGKVHQLMADDDIAFHAGKNNTSGFDNKDAVGVEIIGNDDKDILPIQTEAAQRLVATLSKKYGFNPDKSVFGHGEVATHKQATEGQTVVKALRNKLGQFPVYRTQEEADSAINSGNIKPGDIVEVNGVMMVAE